jgi:hypothetical protein
VAQAVVLGVVQDVGESRADFPRRAERSRVESVGENPSAAPPQAIERPSHADRDALRAAGERATVVGFDDQVDGVGLEGELVESQPKALTAVAEGSENPRAGEVSAQARKSRAHAKGDVERKASIVSRTRDVANPRTGARRLPAGALALAAPGAKREFVLTDPSTSAGDARILLSSSWTMVRVARWR